MNPTHWADLKRSFPNRNVNESVVNSPQIWCPAPCRRRCYPVGQMEQHDFQCGGNHNKALLSARYWLFCRNGTKTHSELMSCPASPNSSSTAGSEKAGGGKETTAVRRYSVVGVSNALVHLLVYTQEHRHGRSWEQEVGNPFLWCVIPV